MDAIPKRARKIGRAGGRIFSGGWLIGRLKKAGPRRIAGIFENNVQKGRLEMTFPGGATHIFEGSEAGPAARVTVRRWRGVRRFLLGGALGMARGYIDQDWTTTDLVALMELGAANRGTLRPGLKGTGWIKALHRWRHKRRVNSPSGAEKNIAFHYDLGNAFYRQWLDPTMTYSSAIFDQPTTTLEEAQRIKYRRLLDMLEVRPGERILEIGCGWGGFAEMAAIERGANVVGITLSREQLVFARERIKQAGLDGQVSIRFCDYRDVHEAFDHVVSIEMFEAVGEQYWQSYFSKIHDVLKPGGRAALQIITIEDQLFEEYRKSADFIQTYIFPGGMLPSLGALKREIQQAGLDWRKTSAFGKHYARTLRAWRERFDSAWQNKTMPEEFDETFRRIWTYYLSYCEGGFLGGSINVHQLALTRRE